MSVVKAKAEDCAAMSIIRHNISDANMLLSTLCRAAFAGICLGFRRFDERCNVCVLGVMCGRFSGPYVGGALGALGHRRVEGGED